MPQPRGTSRRSVTPPRVPGTNLRRTLEHPADRIEDRRGVFDQFAQRASFLASSPLFFIVCLVAVLKNSELRTERALQTKLDAIAGSLLQDRRGHEGDAENQLERSTGVHEEI
jgi:hypothetical protein